MAINKVVYGGDTLIDLTGDTVTEADVMQGVTFHSADGVPRVGTASGGGGNAKVCSARGNANESLSSNSPIKLTINTPIVNSDTNSFELYNGGIRCLKNGIVAISGALYQRSTAAAEVGVYIFMNSVEKTSNYVYLGAPGSSATNVAVSYVEVSVGDVFYLYGRNTASKGTAYVGNVAKHLSVSYVSTSDEELADLLGGGF